MGATIVYPFEMSKAKCPIFIKKNHPWCVLRRSFFVFFFNSMRHFPFTLKIRKWMPHCNNSTQHKRNEACRNTHQMNSSPFLLLNCPSTIVVPPPNLELFCECDQVLQTCTLTTCLSIWSMNYRLAKCISDLA